MHADVTFLRDRDAPVDADAAAGARVVECSRRRNGRTGATADRASDRRCGNRQSSADAIREKEVDGAVCREARMHSVAEIAYETEDLEVPELRIECCLKYEVRGLVVGIGSDRIVKTAAVAGRADQEVIEGRGRSHRNVDGRNAIG